MEVCIRAKLSTRRDGRQVIIIERIQGKKDNRVDQWIKAIKKIEMTYLKTKGEYEPEVFLQMELPEE